MNIQEFRSSVEAGKAVRVRGKDFDVKEVIMFRLDDGNSYIKCFLNDGFVLADDEERNIFVLVKALKTPLERPFPKELDFDGKKFTFLYEAHAVAEEVSGEEILKKGDTERFWDYATEDGSYLSIGIVESRGERLDFYGKVISPENILVF